LALNKCMKSRIRDFIYTSDDLYFATTTYLHPEDRIIAYLRYINDPDGDRSINGFKYSKVDSKQANKFLKENFPDYLYKCDVTQIEMMGVPLENVKKILRPSERLKEIIKHPSPDNILQKVIKIAETLHELTNIPFTHFGISGSILPGLHDPVVSDIDFVVYGLDNHRKAINAFSVIKNDEYSPLKAIKENFWIKLYEKRVKDDSLSYEEFRWYEERKNNRGSVDGTLFDILATRNWNEIEGKFGEETYQPMGTVEIEATISNALAAFDNPAVYQIEDVKILEGHQIPPSEIASYTHTYAGQAREGERIIAKGKLEKVSGRKTRYRLMIGTTRESIGEYIKLKNRNK
jgi:uncharacterized protein